MYHLSGGIVATHGVNCDANHSGPRFRFYLTDTIRRIPNLRCNYRRDRLANLFDGDVICTACRTPAVLTASVANLVWTSGFATVRAFRQSGYADFQVIDRTTLLLFLMRCLFLWLSHWPCGSSMPE